MQHFLPGKSCKMEKQFMKSSNYLLECCVDSAYSARMAKKGGADRLELCSNLVIGGTTPTLALYEQIRNQTDIRIHVLIRPRFGDFLYSEDETALICKEIDAFRAAGADGVVIGSLSPDGSLCTEQLKRFREHARDMSVTLHRAFDPQLPTVCTALICSINSIRQLMAKSISLQAQASLPKRFLLSLKKRP